MRLVSSFSGFVVWAQAGAATVATAAAMRVLLRIFVSSARRLLLESGAERIDVEDDVGSLTSLAGLARQNGPVQFWYTLDIRLVDKL
jgi:hypothetical protein